MPKKNYKVDPDIMKKKKPKNPPKPKRPKPSDLGSGMAKEAAKALQDRKTRIDSAIDDYLGN